MTEAAETPEERQMPEEAVTQELSRRVSLEESLEVSLKVSLEVRRFPTQEIPQDLTYCGSQALSYRWRKDLPENLPQDYYPPQDLPEDCYLPEDLAYQYHQEGRCQQGLCAR
jgi:hypothetical protein